MVATTMSSLFVALFALIVSSFRTRCPAGRSTVRLLSEKAIQTGTKRSKANGRIPLVLLHFVVRVCTASRPKLRYEPEGREFESPRARHVSLSNQALTAIPKTGSDLIFGPFGPTTTSHAYLTARTNTRYGPDGASQNASRAGNPGRNKNSPATGSTR